MTWHSLFDLSTMEHRHLLAAYATVLVIQGGYVGWIAWNWLHSKKSTKPYENLMIRYSTQCIDDDDIQAVVKALRSEYLTQGPLHHSGPLGGALNVLHAGGTVILMSKWVDGTESRTSA